MNFDFAQEFSLTAFKETKSYILVLFPVFFFLRLVYANISASSPEEYGRILKSALLFLALIISYEYLLDLAFLFSKAVRGSEVVSSARDRVVIGSGGAEDGILGISLLRRILGVITSIIYYLAQCLFLVALVFMSALAPIVFLFGTMLSMPVLIKVFYFLVIVGASWPILFSAFDRVGDVLLKTALKGESPFFVWSADFLIELFKLLGPISFVRLLLGTSFASALKSFGDTAKSIGQRTAFAATSGVAGGLGKSPVGARGPQSSSFYSRSSGLRTPGFNQGNKTSQKDSLPPFAPMKNSGASLQSSHKAFSSPQTYDENNKAPNDRQSQPMKDLKNQSDWSKNGQNQVQNTQNLTPNGHIYIDKSPKSIHQASLRRDQGGSQRDRSHKGRASSISTTVSAPSKSVAQPNSKAPWQSPVRDSGPRFENTPSRPIYQWQQKRF